MLDFSIPGAEAPQVHDGVIPRFYMKAKPDKQASDKEGRPIFKEVEYVDVLIPGDKTTCFTTKVADEHRHRWPQAYDAFKRGQAQAVEGTPIESWPLLTITQVAELKALNILTVEALANLSDNGLQQIGQQARALQAKAKAYIDSAKDSALVHKQAKEITDLKDQLEYLKTEVKRISDVYQRDIGKPTPKRRGRQRKVDEPA